MSIGFTHHYAIISASTYTSAFGEEYKPSDALIRVPEGKSYEYGSAIGSGNKIQAWNIMEAYRAISMFKDDYLLDFINVEELFVREKDRDERLIEQSIIHNVKDFIMTFGKDFTFVGNQYHLEKFGVEEFPDLLFYNRELTALVCVELKDGPFKTSYLGQLAGYLRILDDEVRKPHENPSIGILLCKSANKKFVEYVIQDYDKPMGVATYRTTADMDERLKRLLPPVEELEKLL